MSLRTLEKAVNRTADRTVGDIVATYGSNVQRLKMDAAAGKIDPTTALMAMMTIQRIVAANTQPPSGSTVAQDVGMAPPPQPMGMSAMAPQAPVGMAYGGQVAVSNNQVPSPAMERGISGLPVPDNMFDYADGGMIAFAGGGDVQRFQNQGAVRLGQPSDLRLAGFTWDQLPVEDSGMYGPMTRGISELFSRPMNQRKKRDPNTGEYITYSEFIERAAQPQRGAMPQNMSPDMQKYLQQFERGRETMTAPPGADATGRPKIDPFANRRVEPGQIQGNKEAAAISTPTSTQVRPVVEGMDAQPYAGYMDRAESQVRNLMKLPEVTTAEQEVKRMKTADVAAGVDPEFFQKQSLKLEEAKEALKGDRSEAANLRLLEAGLAIMGGTSPFAFVNIGKGASEAMKGFAQDVKDLQKQRKEYDKLQRDLAVAEQTAARTKSAAAYENVERKQAAFDVAKNSMAKATIDLAQSYESVALTKEGLSLKKYLGEKQIEATREQTAASERSRREAEEGRKEYREDQARARYMGLRRQEISDATKEVDAQLNKLSEFEVMQGGKLNPDQQRMKNNLMTRKKLIIQGIDDTYAPLIGDVGGDASGFKLRGTRPAQ